MKAVILAAGEGTRLEPLTNVRPKPMLPVANRPLMEYVVTAARDAGIDELVVVVGYKRTRIQDYFGDGNDWEVDVEYAVQEKQLGTGHAILQAEPFVDEEFVVLNGDCVIESEVIERLVAERERTGETVMAVTPSDHPTHYGVVEVQDDRVVSLTEKPTHPPAGSGLINAGVYAFGPDIFDAIRATEFEGELAVTDTLERAIANGGVRATPYRGLWLDVSYLWDILSVNATVLGRFGAGVADSARVHERATVVDGAAVDADAAVRPNATVLGGTALGENVTVGANAVVENAVVLSDAIVGPGAVVRDCVVGENARVGPNATVEGGQADVLVGDSLHTDVGLGGVLGDNARLGGNATLDRGAVVGNDADVGSGTIVSGRVESGAEIRRG